MHTQNKQRWLPLEFPAVVQGKLGRLMYFQGKKYCNYK